MEWYMILFKKVNDQSTFSLSNRFNNAAQVCVVQLRDSPRRDVLTSLSSSNPVTFIFCTMYRVIWKSSNLMLLVICLYQKYYSHDHKSLSFCYIYLAHVWHVYNRNETSKSLLPFTLLNKFSQRVLWWSWQIFEDGFYKIIIQPEGRLEHLLCHRNILLNKILSW